MYLKVCCIASIDEARQAIDGGANALGLVSAMPSGPGVIDEATIASVAAGVPSHVETYLLTSRVDAASIIAQHARCGTTTIQLTDILASEDEYVHLREQLAGVHLVQVIHVLDEGSVREAAILAPFVDRLLLDSGNPRLSTKELGGTGRVHDWSISARIRERAGVPVLLAGGLRAANVGAAIAAVRPFGLDVCSGVRRDGALDVASLQAFVAVAHRAESSRGV